MTPFKAFTADLAEMMLIWEGIYEGRIGIHITEPVSPVMGSEPPCCGGHYLVIVY